MLNTDRSYYLANCNTQLCYWIVPLFTSLLLYKTWLNCHLIVFGLISQCVDALLNVGVVHVLNVAKDGDHQTLDKQKRLKSVSGLWQAFALLNSKFCNFVQVLLECTTDKIKTFWVVFQFQYNRKTISSNKLRTIWGPDYKKNVLKFINPKMLAYDNWQTKSSNDLQIWRLNTIRILIERPR